MLRADYPALQIAEALEYLRTNGVSSANGHQECHSPLAFLSAAMPQVVKHLEEASTKRQAQADAQLRIQHAQSAAQAQERLEEELWKQKAIAWHLAYPSPESQTQAIEKACEGTFFRPTTEAGKHCAISQWWALRNEFTAEAQ